jgi:hypothetical protein
LGCTDANTWFRLFGWVAVAGLRTAVVGAVGDMAGDVVVAVAVAVVVVVVAALSLWGILKPR